EWWGGVRGGGRVLILAQGLMNSSDHSLRLLQNLIVPESQHAIALRIEKFASHRICPETGRMLAPVHLDDETPFVASIINKIGADRGLATKMKFLSQQQPQMPPKLPLGVGHRAAKLARSLHTVVDLPRFSCLRHCSPPPSPPHHSLRSRGEGGVNSRPYRGIVECRAR